MALWAWGYMLDGIAADKPMNTEVAETVDYMAALQDAYEAYETDDPADLALLGSCGDLDSTSQVKRASSPGNEGGSVWETIMKDYDGEAKRFVISPATLVETRSFLARLLMADLGACAGHA